MIARTVRALALLVGLVVVATCCSLSASAQALPLGTISALGPASCSALSTVGQPDYRDFDPSMTNCFEAQVNCPNADPLLFYYAYSTAGGPPF
jgi:hypothetical protein